MNRIRRNPLGYPVWAPKANIAEGAIVLQEVSVPEGDYVKTYSSMVTDFNYDLPQSVTT
jgi:hypothetical protein